MSDQKKQRGPESTSSTGDQAVARETRSIMVGVASESAPVMVSGAVAAVSGQAAATVFLRRGGACDLPGGDVASLVGASRAASFGHAGSNVVDPTYRAATTIKDCAIVIPALDDIVRAAELALNSGHRLTAKFHSVNIYGAGGFFKEHRDTPAAGLVASLVVCLPTPFEGGGLRVNDAVLEWGGPQSATHLQWAAFFSDCQHEVREVQQGWRIAATFQLLRVRPDQATAPTACAPTALSSLSAAEAAAARAGPAWALRCEHGYDSGLLSAARAGSAASPAEWLKGADGVRFKMLAAAGLEPRVVPVIFRQFNGQNPVWRVGSGWNTLGDYEPPVDAVVTNMGFAEMFFKVTPPTETVHLGRDGDYFEDSYQPGGDFMDALVSNFDVEMLPGMRWAVKPPYDVGSTIASYNVYGNEVSSELLYMECVIAIGDDGVIAEDDERPMK